MAQSIPAAHATQAGTDIFALDLEELMQVVVTSVSKREQTLAQTAAAAHVIQADDIRRSGASNIPEALRLAPGVQVAAIGNNKWAVSIRGQADRFSNKLLVLVDGRSVYSPMFSGVAWEALDIPLENIERIEVIRGPGASIWGANAVNGVINIITRSAFDTLGARSPWRRAASCAATALPVTAGTPTPTPPCRFMPRRMTPMHRSLSAAATRWTTGRIAAPASSWNARRARAPSISRVGFTRLGRAMNW